MKKGDKRHNKAEIKQMALEIAKGATVSATMRKNGYPESTIHSYPRTLTHSPTYIKTLNEAREAIKRKDAKIFDKVADTLYDQLDATIPMGKKLELFPDNDARRQAAMSICKIFGYLSDDVPTNGDKVTINLLTIIQEARSERGLPQL